MEIYGYHLEELADKTAFDLYADPVELERMLGRLRRDGVVREFEIPMKKKDGTIVPMDISISLLKDDQGRTIGSVCLARDLSERKKSEAALKHAQEELRRYSRDLERQVRERTREINSILRYTPAVVYIKDREGRYTLVNSRYEELFGIKQGANLAGKPTTIFSPGRWPTNSAPPISGCSPGGSPTRWRRSCPSPTARRTLSIGEISPV